MRLALLCGGFPPAIDGIGDYSWCLSHSFASQGHQVTVFTSYGPKLKPDQGVTVIPCFDPNRPATIRTFPKILEGKPAFDWLIVQYNPFSFGPRGFNPWLVPSLVRVKRATKVAVMFHETCVPSWPWKFTAMFLWQYPQFVALSFLASRVFVSTERWIRQLRRFNPKIVCHHLPVGSNLPFCALTKEEARARLNLPNDAILLGAFGSAHGSKMLDWVSAAARAVYQRFPRASIFYIGQDGRRIREISDGTPLLDVGCLSAEEAASGIRAMDLLLAPFSDGISTRRTSAMSALQHGVPLCSTISKWSDSVFREARIPALSLCEPTSIEEYVCCVLRVAEQILENADFGNNLRDLYETRFSWPVISKSLLRHLSMEAPAEIVPTLV
jgi:glycosyltransferase involved in cell wall biosynthesis